MDLHKQSMELWKKFQDASTPEERQEVLFELKELSRKSSFISKPIDPGTQNIIDDIDGEVV